MVNGKDLVTWSRSPMRRLHTLNRFSNIFDFFKEFDSFSDNWDLDMKTFTDMQPKANFPKVNVSETDDAYEVEIALAGFNKEDISMELKDNCLCVKADKQLESSEEHKKYLMREISSRSFRRALNFPVKIMTDEVSCVHEDGIVRCILRKEPPKKIEDNIIKIEIK